MKPKLNADTALGIGWLIIAVVSTLKWNWHDAVAYTVISLLFFRLAKEAN